MTSVFEIEKTKQKDTALTFHDATLPIKYYLCVSRAMFPYAYFQNIPTIKYQHINIWSIRNDLNSHKSKRSKSY